MKRVALLSLVLSITSIAVFAQSDVQSQIDQQYFNKSHKAYMYQISPDIKEADKWLLELLLKEEEELLQTRLKADELSSDTTWGYSENKLLGDTLNLPGRYTVQHLDGDSDKYVRYYNQYIWFADSSDWLPSNLSTSYFDESYGDSSKTLYYQTGQLTPYYGFKTISPNVATENADLERFTENYSPETGWRKTSRELRYQNEQERDTLTKSFAFDVDTEEYVLDYIRRYQQTETYALYENITYQDGEIDRRDIQEQTPDFELEERVYYSEGMIISGERSYVKKGDGGRYIYQIQKQYVPELTKWVGVDSLAFEYLDDDKETRAKGFYWADSLWVLDQAYASFQHELNDALVADSVLIYEVLVNEETMLPEIGRVELKTEMEYDNFGNQVEVRNYTIIDDTLRIHSKTLRFFRAFQNFNGDDYYTIVKQESYGRDFFTGELYRSNVSETNYDNTGAYQGNKYFNFSAVGDTTFGYITQRDTLLGGETIEVRFEWFFSLQELRIKSYRIYNRRTTGDQGQGFNQTVFATIINDEAAISRTMNVYNNYPGIFNDGPIYAEMGDTLIHYVSARNPDMSIPEVEVSNMPTSAIFNPETKRFFWVVDEANPSPMTYKAIQGDKFVTTEVEFISEQFAVGTEDELTPNAFRLSQNYPNPFNPSTNISFTIPQSGEVNLKVYNLLGQEVATLVSERMSSGNHTVNFNASQLSSGMYIYRIEVGGLTQTKKMLLIK